MKKIVTCVLLIIASISLLACSKTPDTSESSTTGELESSTTIESFTTSTEAPLDTSSLTSIYTPAIYTPSEFAYILEKNFESANGEIMFSDIHYGQTDQFLDTVGYTVYEYPYFVNCLYQVLPSEEAREEIQNEFFSLVNENLEENTLSDDSFVRVINEEDYFYCYFYINGVEDFAIATQDSLQVAESFVTMYGLESSKFQWIGFYYFAGDFMIASDIATDNEVCREDMEAFIRDLGLPEI